MARFDEAPFTVVATGLPTRKAPWPARRQRAPRRGQGRHPDPHRARRHEALVATLGGSPNGAAIGPDGASTSQQRRVRVDPGGPLWVTGDQPPDYQGGSIQRVDARRQRSTTALHELPATPARAATLPLRGPDDLVFDGTGGFWFTDWGKSRPRDRDVTGVYYARPDGSPIREALFPLNAPNGIALSPDGTRLYVAETYTRRILYWTLSGPGEIAPNPDPGRLLPAHRRDPRPGHPRLDGGGRGRQRLRGDDAAEGADPTANGGITIVTAAGRRRAVPRDRHRHPGPAPLEPLLRRSRPPHRAT